MDEKRLTGPALQRRLSELAADANQHHHGVTTHWQGMLDHARQAGEALIEVKWRLGNRTKWTKWRRNHFEGSKEKSCHYMRVARHWDDPRIQKARADGVTLDSIHKFLKFLRADAPEGARTELSLRELEIETARDDLRKQFAAQLRLLDHLELKVLADRFEERSWPALHNDVKQTVCQATESDYYVEESETEKREIRSKVTNALNDRVTTRHLAKTHPR